MKRIFVILMALMTMAQHYLLQIKEAFILPPVFKYFSQKASYVKFLCLGKRNHFQYGAAAYGL